MKKSSGTETSGTPEEGRKTRAGRNGYDPDLVLVLCLDVEGFG